ncbi:hypothetical protein T03_15998 [Trichinella britovi]|uniref:Uncharacterized protein n=1 Tax=Trichinella britovi TaxID=45882 RepID=A0A0V0YRH7_TRIBR|nr:hypothetical protein T03_15998 [Trichinella britovi]
MCSAILCSPWAKHVKCNILKNKSLRASAAFFIYRAVLQASEDVNS